MGTVAGLRTRRYHGLLAVAAGGPSARMLGLAALDAVLVVGDARYRLATDEWAAGVVDPRGYELLVSFDLDEGVPRWRWQVGDVVLERELAMTHGRCAVGVVHRLLRADRPVALELTPLCTWRSVHGERWAGGRPGDRGDRATASSSRARTASRGAGWRPGGAWYRGVRAREEAARGLERPRGPLGRGRLLASSSALGDAHEVTAAAAPFDGDLPRRGRRSSPAARERGGGARPAPARPRATADAQLVLAADQFVIDHDGPTAVAGYPWFGEWSRDLMTSYEGLFLSTGRADEGRGALRRAAATLSEGMLANTADTGALEYNTVDGTLWFVHALGRHLAVTGDDDLGARARAGARRDRDPPPGRHAVRDRRRPGDGLLRQGSERLGADVDGRAHRRRARSRRASASRSR